MTKFIWKQSAVSILHDVYWYIIKCNAAFVCISRVQRKSVLQLPFQASFSLAYTSPGVILTCPKAFWRAGLVIINQNLSVISIPVLLIHSNNNFECYFTLFNQLEKQLQTLEICLTVQYTCTSVIWIPLKKVTCQVKNRILLAPRKIGLC